MCLSHCLAPYLADPCPPRGTSLIFCACMVTPPLKHTLAIVVHEGGLSTTYLSFALGGDSCTRWKEQVGDGLAGSVGMMSKAVAAT